MEICNKSVNTLKFVAGIDEDACPIVIFADLALCLTDRFKGAAAGRADGDNPAPVLLCFIDYFRSFGRDHIMLGVHLVFLDILGFNRAESADTDMESDKAYLNSLVPDLLQKLGREMQSCSRSGSRA